MAEIFKSTEAGETTQLFIQFVMMQHQQTLFALGRHPGPLENSPRANFRLAKAFIDQLGMIREKTRGNLNADEERVIDAVLGEVRLKYIEATTAPEAGLGT